MLLTLSSPTATMAKLFYAAALLLLMKQLSVKAQNDGDVICLDGEYLLCLIVNDDFY